MFIASKKYARTGRIRFGSGVFIDDIVEKRIDNLEGFKRDNSILYLYVILIFVKLIAANFVGLIVVTLLFYLVYFLSIEDFRISFTDNRLFLVSEYRYPKVVKAFGYVFLGFSIFTVLKLIFPDILNTTKAGLEPMQMIFDFFQLLPFFYFLYVLLIEFYMIRIVRFEVIISVIIYLWFTGKYLRLGYKFTEIHYSHLSEQLLSLRGQSGFIRSTLIAVSALFTQLMFFGTFNLILIFFFLILYEVVPKTRVAQLSLFGNSGRPLINKITFSPKEFQNSVRTTAAIFGWTPQGNYATREYPSNIIPREVASHYETGLRASLIPAYHQANKIGVIISSAINSIVIFLLFRFSQQNNPAALNLVALIALGVGVITIIFWQLLKILSTYIVSFQREEYLMIGSTFIGRYIEPSLWIMKGNRLEGTRVKRGVSGELIRFDKNKGLVIAWRALSFYLIFVLGGLMIILWTYAGALNPANTVYIIPFILDKSIIFLSAKATTELGFFILLGYLFWVIFYLSYPRFYSLSRPQLSLEMQYPTSIPVILKDFEDYQDASLQFTKCLIGSSRPSRRKSIGRPGMFEVDVMLQSIHWKKEMVDEVFVLLQLGDSRRQTGSFSLKPLDDQLTQPIMENIRISAATGYPRLYVNLFYLVEDENQLKFENIFELENNTTNHLTLETEDFSVVLAVRTKRGKN